MKKYKKWPGTNRGWKRDITIGRKAEKYIAQLYLDNFYATCDFITFNKNKDYDISFSFPRKESTHIEVKFDKYAVKSKNLCFELRDHKERESGIMGTKANLMVFVVAKELQELKSVIYEGPTEHRWPKIISNDKHIQVFEFDVPELREFIEDHVDSVKYKIVKGGDGRAFEMMLIPITEIIKESFCKRIE